MSPTPQLPLTPSPDESELLPAPNMLPLLAPELLVATLSAGGNRLHTNEAWDHLFGSESAWERLSVEDRRFAEEYVLEAASGSLVTNQVFLIERSETGQPAPVLLHFLPARVQTDTPGRFPVVITGEVLQEPTSWAQDQTKRRRMELLGQMAMGIAHDFNNLLTSILGHSELIKEELPYGTTREHLRSIERASLDGAALVRKIQRYIRHEKSERFEHIDLAAIVEETVALTRPYWHNEPRRLGIAIELQKEVEAVQPIYGSEPELREVFVNLILNAVQAMPEGGTLTLRVFGDDQSVYAEVEDSGMGMPESVRQRIFEPLFTTKGEAGTGMGLTVTYGIVEEHDGLIRVRSKPGRGTCFQLSFPPAENHPGPQAPEVTSAPQTGDAPSPQSARILVVDDDPMVRTVTSKLLRLRGHDVTLAAGGAEALETMAQEPFDLVVTDLGMPEMSGRELALHLRQQHPGVPIVMLTGHTDAEDQAENVDAVVKKPFRIDALDAALQQLLRSQQG